VPASHSKFKRWIVFLVLLVLGAAAYRFWPAEQPVTKEAVRRPVIALLVLENLNKQPELDFLSNALSRETTAKVGQLFSGNLDVIAYRSVAVYRDTRKTLHQIGRELQVDYILRGGIRKDSQRIHITTELIRVSDESQLWSSDHDSVLEDVSDAQSEIIDKLAATLGTKVNPSDRDALNRAGTNNAEAREAYLRGVDQIESHDEAEVRKAIVSFGKALSADPGYSRAHAALAEAELHNTGQYEKAEQHARRALELTTAIPQAHVVVAEILFKYRNNAEEAEKELKTAVALNENDAEAQLRYAEFLLLTRRLDEAQLQIQRARRLDPFSVEPNLMFGRILTEAKLYDQAVEQLGQTVSLDRNSPEIRFYLGQAYLARGMNDDAIREFQRAASFGPNTPEYIAALGEAYAAARRYDEARTQLQALKELARKRAVPPALIDSLSRRVTSS
jgi:TolB-like protein